MHQQQIIEKFNKLRFRISFKSRETHSFDELEVINDMDWVKRQIEYLEGGVVLDKSHLIKANNLWKQYSDKLIIIDDWEYIDSCLEQLTDTRYHKIEAIKEYRKRHKCGLREAKDTIEVREMKLKGKVYTLYLGKV